VPAFALIHSPLVGPVTWSAVADELSRRQVGVVVPDLGAPVETETGRHWKRHVASAARAIASVPVAASVVLVGHSGAGALLPAIRVAMDRACTGYIFVDAGLPSSNEPRKGTGGFARHLDEIHAQGERFPDWSDENLREALPVPAVRTALLGELRPQPPDFWDEIVPVFAGWPDAPCAYIRFGPNPSYDAAAAEAQRRGWRYRDLGGAHFHMLVDPVGVSDELLAIEAGIRPEPRRERR
jgi:hypothetical protein